MQFPNAAKGVKRIFTAEILSLIGTVCSIIGAIVMIIGLAAGSAATQANSDSAMAVAGGGIVGGGIFLIIAGVLGIIGFIMYIVGLVNAGKDEASFKTALICVLVGIVGSFIGSIFSSSPVVSSIGSLVTNIASLCATIFVIAGIIKLADQLNNGEISAKGNNVLKMIIIVNVLAIIANLIVLILGGYAASVVAGIIYLIALILTVVQFIMFLSLLAKAKKMLAA